MRRFICNALAAMLVLTSGGLLADAGHPVRPPAKQYHRHGGGHLDWFGAFLLLGVTAALLNAATNQPPAPPPPKYAIPAPVPPNHEYIERPMTTGMWYYCRSAEQYYPYVRSCPEGWEELPPIPSQ